MSPVSHPSPLLIVVGQGYVGLPLAMRAVDAGFDVVGLDVDRSRVDALAAGISFVEDVPDAQVTAALDSGRYAPRSSLDGVDRFDHAIISVPTPLRETLPDLSYIESAARTLGAVLRPGATVVLESTTSPGTTAEVLVPILEAVSGLSAGRDFHVGFSPERIDPGNSEWSFRTTPKIVSGIDDASLAEVTKLYDALVDVTVPVPGTREAELAKLIENTFRHVNIALVNELAIAAHDLGINIWQALDAAGTKPFGFMKFMPGPGVGGHCLPVDPSYLSWEVRRKLGRSLRFVELANEVNEGMPEYVVRRLEALLNDESKAVRGANVLLVGLSYKADSGDVREAPAVHIARLLAARGASVTAVDPHVSDRDWPAGVVRSELDDETAASADVSVVLTRHTDVDLGALRGRLVLDTRNVVDEPTRVVL
ncbi:nucleotide sugar dehydrogenase [Frigoribacterium sp. MCBA15_019]|uniref:nucleotide sugar dehydrogenase n=1 Tax=unclassified Frigoribacterium TaxID=2627005 RepID=UPI0008DD7EFF|nr:nucleotide sugar dehydrogenase [Frigoribacterium sp. MCBA15_019]OII21827.1 UDP-N-acetyl-D-glucosamine dehydrogenase [Frigoribacterium sp. MCBA15_019]